jgi:drug/metabolite transporter (DMT)-like permease
LTLNRNLLAFSLLCLIWGATWIGIKAGIQVVPPLFFAGTRFTCAGLIFLLMLSDKTQIRRLIVQDGLRMIIVSLLMISLCYGPLFWGMQFIDSGTSAVLELTLTPVALLSFALLLKEEKYDLIRMGAIMLGVCGICILFAPDILAVREFGSDGNALRKLVGGAAVASAAIIYALGSVLARPLLANYSTTLISGVTTLVGGLVLITASLIFETHNIQSLTGQWGVEAWLGWWFLVLFGSLIGYGIYMRLLKEIGASAAGSYAFVSPVIAVILGAVAYSEPITPTKVIGMIVMLSGAYFVVGYKKSIK